MATKRRWVTREIVVQTAIRLADEAGDVNDVTLTTLARALNIRTPSLYNHIEGLDDLRQAMALATVEELTRSIRHAVEGLSGREALLAAARIYRQFAGQHPGVYALVIRAPDAREAALSAAAGTLLQTLLLILASMGLHGDDALHAVRGLRAILHGFVSLEVASGFKLDLDREESFRRLLLAYIAGLPAKQ